MKQEDFTGKIIGCAMKEYKRVYNLNHPENKDYIAYSPKIIKS